MKNRTTKAEIATPQAKGKVKLKTLKFSKETLENLSDHDAATVKGGGRTYTCSASTVGL